jgi:hypothetical protein
MKKTILAMLVVAGLAGITIAQAPASAPAKKKAAKVETVTGAIVSLDTAAKTIVVKDNADQTDKTFAVNPKELNKLTAGELVKVKFHAGNDKAISVKRVPPIKKIMEKPVPKAPDAQ